MCRGINAVIPAKAGIQNSNISLAPLGERVWMRGKPLAGFALLLLLGAFGASAFGDATPANIKDPYQYVWKDEGSLAGMTRFFLEINGKSPALFLAANSLIGNGGGSFHVFLPNGDSYKNLGVIFSQPGGVEVLPTLHNRIHDLKTCTHIGGSKYDCKTYSFNGKTFSAAASKEITQDRLSAEVKPTQVKVERSDNQITWRP